MDFSQEFHIHFHAENKSPFIYLLQLHFKLFLAVADGVKKGQTWFSSDLSQISPLVFIEWTPMTEEVTTVYIL